MEVHMGRSTPQAVVVACISFETTRLSPQCLVEAYARILPVTRKPLAIAGPVPAQTRRTEHG
jgi:hypothetical protein